MIEEELTSVRLPSRVYDQIERSVVRLYKELNIRRIPVDPFDIIRRKGYILKPYSALTPAARIEFLTREQEGISYYDPELGTFVIYYDDSFPYLRVQFTLMHEIGHITLGHRQESALAKKMADYYAAYALAPSPLMNYFGCEDYVEVAQKFDISLESADICFIRYENWVQFSGRIKDYENELLDLFDQNHIDGSDAYDWL